MLQGQHGASEGQRGNNTNEAPTMARCSDANIELVMVREKRHDKLG
jgi:hypothetical protein